MKLVNTVSEERLAQIYSELQHGARICELSDVIAPLSNAELEAAYDDALMRYCRQLAFGALDQPEWVSGTLVVNANQELRRLLKTALDAMECEIERRKATVMDRRHLEAFQASNAVEIHPIALEGECENAGGASDQ
jgi:hypothetical protein